jgi:UDP-GlcNAc:undecaprenyl-phosphate GlcNAc-1-phosphate transferase
MRSYIILFTTSLILSFVLTPLVRGRAIQWGAVDVPGGRRIHARPTPRLGGIAIYLAFVLTLLCVPFLSNDVSARFENNLAMLMSMVIPATGIFLFGVYDDFRGSTPLLKVIVQAAAGLAVYALGFRIEMVSLPMGGALHLPMLVSVVVTLLWIIGITNAFNLIDGIDGLAAGASAFAVLSILIMSISMGVHDISLIAAVLTGAVIGFLRYNFNPATIFLGDSGSLFLGFMAAVLSLASSQKSSTMVAIAIPLVTFGLPVAEVGISLLRRFVSGAPLLGGDRGHIHHMLLRRGLNQRQTVILLYGICAAFSLCGLMLLNAERGVVALVFLIVGVSLILGVQHLRYPEFSELRNQIRGSVVRRRRAMAVNVGMRRASSDLSEARTLNEFFETLAEALAVTEFDCAVLESGEMEGVRVSANNARLLLPSGENWQVIWNWERGDVSLERAISSGEFWSLRLPLTREDGTAFGALTVYHDFSENEPVVDLKNLCGDFQREISTTLAALIAKESQPGAQPVTFSISQPEPGAAS